MVKTAGHRGAAGVLPENTIEGFEYAMGLGVDFVECDVHLTWDDHLVVMHDDTVDRTTNGTGAIRTLRLETIRRLDAGRGLRVPTLDEVLSCVQGRVHLLCELKGEGVEYAAVEAVRARNMVSQVTFSCFDLDRLERVRGMGEELALAAIVPALDPGDFARAVELKARTVDVHYRQVCLSALERVHEEGMTLCAWNPDTVEEQQLMIALGADCISSNRPDILMQAVRAYHRV